MYKLCVAEGCTTLIRVSSVWCSMHRRRHAKHGDVNFRHTKTLSLPERFRLKYKPCKETGCWNWTGGLNKSGYGTMAPTEFGTLAHRISYGLNVGPIPKGNGTHGTCVCHKCDNTKCVNPDHLFLASNAENVADRDAKGRHNPLRGSANGMAKLTEKQVREIRLMYPCEGVFLRHVAERYSITTTTVSDVVNRKIWKHI